jgi:hypothetical protein
LHIRACGGDNTPNSFGHKNLVAYNIPNSFGHKNWVAYNTPNSFGHKNLVAYNIPNSFGHKNLVAYNTQNMQCHVQNLILNLCEYITTKTHFDKTTCEHTIHTAAKTQIGHQNFCEHLKQTPHWVLLVLEASSFLIHLCTKFLIGRHYNLFCCISSNMRSMKS